jgi:hypothetical protein
MPRVPKSILTLIAWRPRQKAVLALWDCKSLRDLTAKQMKYLIAECQGRISGRIREEDVLAPDYYRECQAKRAKRTEEFLPDSTPIGEAWVKLKELEGRIEQLVDGVTSPDVARAMLRILEE